MFIESRAEDLPTHHDDLLIVKLRPTAAPVLATALETADFALSEAPGLSIFSTYERAGLIRRVMPLSRTAAVPEMAGMAAGLDSLNLIASTAEADASPNAGLSMIELQPNANAHELQVALGADPNVEFVAPVPARYLCVPAPRKMKIAAVSAPTATPPQSLWNLERIGWNPAKLPSARHVRVAVLDSGLDPNHPDLPHDLEYVCDYPGVSAVSGTDILGHGTHVAGTIVARNNNGIGVSGICDCTLVSYKIFSDEMEFLTNGGYFAFVVEPILYRAALAECLEADGQKKVDVINLSIGGYGEPDPQERKLIADLVANGTVVVAAMGNHNTTKPSYPAAIPGVVAVGATSYDDSRASFSNIGGHITLSAPGVGIWSTLPTYAGRRGNLARVGPNGAWIPGAPIAREMHYAAWQGTSMAAPHVSAAAALIRAGDSGLSAAEVYQRLQAATDPVPGMAGKPFTPAFGSGRLNLSKI
jgi:hypothetical protein